MHNNAYCPTILFFKYLQKEIGQQLFDSLAKRLYVLLEEFLKYQQYLELIDIQSLCFEENAVESLLR